MHSYLGISPIELSGTFASAYRDIWLGYQWCAMQGAQGDQSHGLEQQHSCNYHFLTHLPAQAAASGNARDVRLTQLPLCSDYSEMECGMAWWRGMLGVAPGEWETSSKGSKSQPSQGRASAESATAGYTCLLRILLMHQWAPVFLAASKQCTFSYLYEQSTIFGVSD